MGTTTSTSEAAGSRFLTGCPPMPPPPNDADVQVQFEDLLRSKLVTAAVLDELSSIESIETKWMYICLNKFLMTHDFVDEKAEILDPHDCIQEMADINTHLQESASLHDFFRAMRINMILRSKDWVDKFVEAHGVQALVALLDPAKTVPPETHAEVVHALLALSNSNRGMNAMVQTSDCCERLLALYRSPPSTNAKIVRGRVLKLLGIVCCHNQTAQNTAVAAIARYGEDASSSKFGWLAEGFLESEQGAAFQLDVITFINIVINTTLDAAHRMAIRDDLNKTGFTALAEKYKADESGNIMPGMVMQIQIFLKGIANDHAKLTAAAPSGGGGFQRRLSLNIPSAADEPVAPSVDANSEAVAMVIVEAFESKQPSDEAATSGSVATESTSTPQREGPRSLQSRKSLMLDMSGLHTETSEISATSMVSPPPAPEPVQRRPSGSLLPTLSIPKVNIEFMATKATAFHSPAPTPKPSQAQTVPPAIVVPVTPEAELEGKSQPSLESIIAMLQQGAKNLDASTSQKLVQVLSSLATSLTTSDGASGGGAKVVESLEKSLCASSHEAAVVKEQPPSALPKIQLRLPNRYSESDVTALSAAGTPAKAGYHYNAHPRFQYSGSSYESSSGASTPVRPGAPRSPSFSSGATAGGDHAPRSPAHSHGDEEHSPRRSMTETESYDESSHEYEMASRNKSSGGGAKLALAGFFQHLKKGQGLPSTPAPTPMATASIKKDARRHVFPSFGNVSAAPSPMPVHLGGHFNSFALPPLTPLKPSLSLPPLTPMRPQVVPTTPTPIAMIKSPRVANEDHLEAVKEEENEPPSPHVHLPAAAGPDISKFRKLLAMGAPRTAVRAKMQQAGVDPNLLDQATPQATAAQPSVVSLPAVAQVIQTSTVPPPPDAAAAPDVSKFRKLLSMGAPLAAVKAKMQQAGVDPALLDQPASVETTQPAVAPPIAETPETVEAVKSTKIKDSAEYAKFFKLRAMGAPAEAVKAKMRQVGANPDFLDTPDADMPCSTEPVVQVCVKDDANYAKFFKLQSMGAPAAAVKAKMLQAGLNPDFLDTPDALVPSKYSNNNNNAEHAAVVPKVLVKDDPAYAKFFKLKTMAPVEVVKMKMKQAGLDPNLLDTPDAEVPSTNTGGGGSSDGSFAPSAPAKPLLSAGAALANMFANRQDGNQAAASTTASQQPVVLVKDDPAYAKFFKLVAMGAPPDTVKGKMTMAGLRPELLDTPDAPLNPPPAAGDGATSGSSNNSNQATNSSGQPQAAGTAASPPAGAAPGRRGNLALSIKLPATISKPTTRPFYWQQMKGDSIKGTIWEEIEKEQNVKENNEPPVFLADLELSQLEQEFPAQTAPMTGPNKQSRSLSMDQLPNELLSPRVVFLIDRSRANNISIIIKQFRMSHAALREAVMKLDATVLTLDRVQGLLKILPTDEEVAAIVGYKGDPMSLNEAERVLKELISVPRLKQRLTAMQSKLQFPGLVRDLQHKVDKLRSASTEIAQSGEFKTILLVVLQVGNRMNQGSARGGAKGFRLGDLPKLAQLKSADKTTTLLHYVARMIRQKRGNSVRLSDSLSSLYDVQNIPIPELPVDMNKIGEIVDFIAMELGAHKLKNSIEERERCDQFVKVMDEFMGSATQTTATLKDELDAMLHLMKDTMQRFGFLSEGGSDGPEADAAPAAAADPAAANHAALTSACEFFTTIYEFSVALVKADRENEVKRLREEARVKQSLKPKNPALGPRSMSSRDMLSVRKPSLGTVLEKKKSEPEMTTSASAGPEAPESGGSSSATGPRVSPMLRQRSASLSSILENNTSMDAVLAAVLPVTVAAVVGGGDPAVEKVKSPTKSTTPTKKTSDSPGAKASCIRPPTMLPKPSSTTSASSTSKDSVISKAKPVLAVPGRIVKTGKPSSGSPPSPSPKDISPEKRELFSVCYDSPLGLTMPLSLEKPKSKPKPEFEEFTPFDMASIEEIRAELAKKHVSAGSNNNNHSDMESVS